MTPGNQDKYLKFGLRAFGVSFLLIYPMSIIWPAGILWHGGDGV
jgi:hypothetical protein